MAVWLLYLLLVGVGVVCFRGDLTLTLTLPNPNPNSNPDPDPDPNQVSFRGETLPEAPPRPACHRGRIPLLVLAVLTPSFLPPLWMRCSMVKVPPWQCLRLAPAPPQGAPGSSGWLSAPTADCRKCSS